MILSEVGVQGYPTIKYGDPNGLEDYEGRLLAFRHSTPVKPLVLRPVRATVNPKMLKSSRKALVPGGSHRFSKKASSWLSRFLASQVAAITKS